MPSPIAALTSLLPLAAAIALTVKGFARLRGNRRPAPGIPPQPKEIAPPEPSPRRGRTSLPDASCEGCGTSIPGGDTVCPLCTRGLAAPVSAWRTTALHWLAAIGLMGVIFGLGAFFAQ